MFDINDIYTSSGTTSLWGCWTKNVTKHDTSSFYNWEADNEPLYDLEERTFLNWEQHGFPTSSITGLALTVSADAPSVSAGCGYNIFTTVSAAIASLPQVLDFPVLIEVGNFGNQEYLNLDNIKMGKRGSLEIINRNFAKVNSVSSLIKSIDTPNLLVGSISSLDLSNVFYATAGSDPAGTTSCVDIKTSIWSATSDIRVPNNYSVITEMTEKATWSNDLISRNHRLSVGRGSEIGDIRHPTSPNHWFVSAHEITSPTVAGETLYGADCSTIDLLTTAGDAVLRDWTPINGEAVSLLYGNHFSGISISNCDGPIYFRNFFVDGNRTGKTGFAINNCTNLVLENCASIRNIENGFEINNSNVTVTRGIVGYRNYNVVGSARDYGGGGSWSSISGTDLDMMAEPYPGNGLEANNSLITFSSTLTRETNYGAVATDFLANFSRNTRGIVLNNSVLTGGVNRGGAAIPAATRLVAELNVDKGLHTDNSKISLNGILDLHGNGRGAVIKNSIAELDHLIVQNNQQIGFHCINSTLRYNKNVFEEIAPQEAYLFSANGQHLVVDKGSTVAPIYTSSMDTNGYNMKFVDSFGHHTPLGITHRNLLPSISVTDNSNLTLLHANIDRTRVLTKHGAIYGAGVEAKNNSKIKFQGSVSRCTQVKGPASYADQRSKAGVYAQNNSEIEFNGPTVIAQWAVDALAEDNSTLNFNPHRNLTTGGYDVSTFNLTNSRNHTSVELHSTRACLVANRNSTINMRDLGDFQWQWSGTNGLSALAELPDLVTSGDRGDGIDQQFNYATSAGSIQFYPNANEEAAYAPPYNFNSNATTTETFSEGGYYNYNILNYYNQSLVPSTVSTGGMCVRAVDNSVINARNVHFPCGFANASGLYYDVGEGSEQGHGILCSFIHIWNIADTSRLNASYLSVSGNYPMDAGYFGPCAVYPIAGGAGGGAAYTAPESTPDTSSLAVLDFYGQGTGVVNWPDPSGNLSHIYGKTTPQNQGPFRLYVGVDGLTNELIDISAVHGNVSGHLNQVFAQGYNFSSDLNVYHTGTSSLFGKSLRFSSTDGLPYTAPPLVTSGFYYCSALVPPNTYQRILLDESAANTFANAKNGAMGTSGRSQICTIHQLHTTRAGESAAATYKDRGLGFKSPNIFDLDRDN